MAKAPAVPASGGTYAITVRPKCSHLCRTQDLHAGLALPLNLSVRFLRSQPFGLAVPTGHYIGLSATRPKPDGGHGVMGVPWVAFHTDCQVPHGKLVISQGISH